MKNGLKICMCKQGFTRVSFYKMRLCPHIPSVIIRRHRSAHPTFQPTKSFPEPRHETKQVSHKHTKLAMLELLPTLFSHIFAVSFFSDTSQVEPVTRALLQCKTSPNNRETNCQTNLWNNPQLLVSLFYPSKKILQAQCCYSTVLYPVTAGRTLCTAGRRFFLQGLETEYTYP